MLKPFSKNQSREIQSHHLHHGNNTGKLPTRKDRIGQGKSEKKREIIEANGYQQLKRKEKRLKKQPRM